MNEYENKVIDLLNRIAAAVEFLAMQQGHVPPAPPARDGSEESKAPQETA